MCVVYLEALLNSNAVINDSLRLSMKFLSYKGIAIGLDSVSELGPRVAQRAQVAEVGYLLKCSLAMLASWG